MAERQDRAPALIRRGALIPDRLPHSMGWVCRLANRQNPGGEFLGSLGGLRRNRLPGTLAYNFCSPPRCKMLPSPAAALPRRRWLRDWIVLPPLGEEARHGTSAISGPDSEIIGGITFAISSTVAFAAIALHISESNYRLSWRPRLLNVGRTPNPRRHWMRNGNFAYSSVLKRKLSFSRKHAYVYLTIRHDIRARVTGRHTCSRPWRE